MYVYIFFIRNSNMQSILGIYLLWAVSSVVQFPPSTVDGWKESYSLSAYKMLSTQRSYFGKVFLRCRSTPLLFVRTRIKLINPFQIYVNTQTLPTFMLNILPKLLCFDSKSGPTRSYCLLLIILIWT